MQTSENKITINSERTVLVRVCCSAHCSKPHRVFGCTPYSGTALYCDDCRRNAPCAYLQCALRAMDLFPERVTHGFCRECAQDVMAAARMHRTIEACVSGPARNSAV